MIVQINKPKIVTSVISSSKPVVTGAVSIVNTNAAKQGAAYIQQQPIVYKRYHIQTPKTIWTVTHDQNTDRFMVVLRDEQGEQFDAKIVRVNSKTIEVHLMTALSGYVDLIFDVSSNPVIAV